MTHWDKYQKLIDALCKKKHIHELVAMIENTEGTICWSSEYNKTVDSPLLLASITKLFTTTCILILKEEHKLSLSDPISQYLEPSVLDQLHVYKGVDYSSQLTISHLLFQRSGLPDYFLTGNPPLAKKILTEDFYLPFDELVTLSKSLNPRFQPNKPGKAYYADLNFDLLGKIIEQIEQQPLQQVVKTRIIAPLGLSATYVMASENDYTPTIYYKQQQLIPTKYLCSFPASGGGISTARELMIFLKAFWKGQLFDAQVFQELTAHNRLQLSFGGISYAGGYMHINSGLPWTAKQTLIGHSGSTGSFAFYCPESDLFFVGDVNQFADPSIPIRLAMQLEITTRTKKEVTP